LQDLIQELKSTLKGQQKSEGSSGFYKLLSFAKDGVRNCTLKFADSTYEKGSIIHGCCLSIGYQYIKSCMFLLLIKTLENHKYWIGNFLYLICYVWIPKSWYFVSLWLQCHLGCHLI